MSLPFRTLLLALASAGFGVAAPSHAADPVTGTASYVNHSGAIVHCVSTESGRTYCGTASTRYVIHDTPSTTCVEGQTWGFDERGVWVSGGCSANFAVAPDGDAVTSKSSYVDSKGRSVRCVSTASGRTYCGEPHMRYTISANAAPLCSEGRTWGYDDRGVWVSGGCVADFTLTDAGTAIDRNGNVVRCVANAEGRTFCGTPHKRYVIRGTPPATCIEGKTWGLDEEHGVWVSTDCTAEFEIVE